MALKKISRRTFVSALGGAAAWPLAARGQSGMPVIGVLDTTSASESGYRIAAFRQGLIETGFIEGQHVTFDYRWAQGQIDRLPAMADELVRRPVALILTQNISTPAAKAATTAIPIVFVSGGDPVQSGLVPSLRRPGGNVTGTSFTTTPLSQKRLELLHELIPGPAAIALLIDSRNPSGVRERADVEAAARGLGRSLLVVEATDEPSIDAAFSTMVQARAGALFIGGGAFYTSRRRQLAALAARHALPTITNLREFVMVGCLMSYGASDTEAYRKAGTYAGRILKGAKPGDLPVEMPSRYELVINLATAKALGLAIPAKVLALADEVIE